MSRDKQIEEMYLEFEKWDDDADTSVSLAEWMYNAGYRKASEVAREILEEIEKNMVVFGDATLSSYFRGIGYRTFAELKKKYESEEIK